MKSSLVRKAGQVFLCTATGFCWLSAEPGLSQDAPTAPAMLEAPFLPLEPPRPAIRETAPDLPAQLVAAPPAPLPLITRGTLKKVPPPVITPRQNNIQPQIVPRTGTRAVAAPGLIITPGPSTNPALSNQPAAPAPVRPVAHPVAEAKRAEEMFEMPALSVPTPDGEALNASQEPEVILLEAPAQTQEPKTKTLPQGPSLGLSAHVIGMEGCCPVTLRDGRMQVPGLDEYTSEWQGIVYRFATPQAKQRFEARPEHYAPAHGGMDIIRTADEGEDVPGSLDHAIWYRRQLYLFQDGSTLKAFTANPEKYLAK